MVATSDLRVDISVRMDLSMSMTSARVGSATAAGVVARAVEDGGGLGFAVEAVEWVGDGFGVAAGVEDDGAVAEDADDRLDCDTRLSRAW